MIVNNLNFKSITVSPNETNAILIVNPDTVLAFPITFKASRRLPGKIVISLN
jgi:hypothetical protein